MPDSWSLAVLVESGAEMGLAMVRTDVLMLLREKRYEELLALLYQAQAEDPASGEIRKSIAQVKEFLFGACAERLGGLDQVAVALPPGVGQSPDVVLLSRYIDGVSTYGDLAEVCPLGRLRTLQLLVRLYPREGVSGTQRVADSEVPHSGPRAHEGPHSPSEVVDLTEDRGPITARSPSAAPTPSADDPAARKYQEKFAEGTAAFIQRRCADAVTAFETCIELRPGDPAAETMLRRSRRDLESQVR